MENRYYYEAGCGKESISGNVLAENHQEAMTMITKAFKDIGYEQSEINYVNIDHVDNDDILARQYEAIENNFAHLKIALMDSFDELGISNQDILNITTGKLSAKTCYKLVQILGLK